MDGGRPGWVEGEPQSVKSAQRALQVLEVLSSQGHPMSLADLSRALAVPRSSLHAILRTMRQRRWIEADESGQRFGLGLRALLTGSLYVDGDPVVLACRSTLSGLVAATGETAHLGRLDPPDIVFLDKRESPEPVRLFSAVGRRLPAHATALGKAILATRTEREVEAAVAHPLTQLTVNTIADLDRLHEELASTRQRGYAVDNEENSEGVRCYAVALPVRHPVEEAVSVSIPRFRHEATTETDVVAALRRAVPTGPGQGHREELAAVDSQA